MVKSTIGSGNMFATGGDSGAIYFLKTEDDLIPFAVHRSHPMDLLAPLSELMKKMNIDSLHTCVAKPPSNQIQADPPQYCTAGHTFSPIEVH